MTDSEQVTCENCVLHYCSGMHLFYHCPVNLNRKMAPGRACRFPEARKYVLEHCEAEGIDPLKYRDLLRLRGGVDGRDYKNTEKKRLRTLVEIIEAAKDGQMPTHEECYWAMLALESLYGFDRKAIRELATKPESVFNTPKYQYEMSHQRREAASKTAPKEWMGPSFDPANPEYQATRSACKKVVDNFLKGRGSDG